MGFSQNCPNCDQFGLNSRVKLDPVLYAGNPPLGKVRVGTALGGMRKPWYARDFGTSTDCSWQHGHTRAIPRTALHARHSPRERLGAPKVNSTAAGTAATISLTRLPGPEYSGFKSPATDPTQAHLGWFSRSFPSLAPLLSKHGKFNPIFSLMSGWISQYMEFSACYKGNILNKFSIY